MIDESGRRYYVIWGIVFMLIGVGIAYIIDEQYFKQDRENLILQECGSLYGSDERICGLIIEPNPLFILLPLGMFCLGLILGNAQRVMM